MCHSLRIRGQLPAPIVNSRISNFEGLVTLTLTLTLDRFILHTVVHQSSTSTYMPNLIEIEDTVCGRTDGFEIGLIRSTLSKGRPNKIIRGFFFFTSSAQVLYRE